MVAQVSGLDPKNPNESWWSSSHRAEQSRITDWFTDNVRVTSNGTVELVLDNAPKGSPEPWAGGEINSNEHATTGTFSWTAQAPKMVDGAVWGLFAYKANWNSDPWVEFDFEWAGKDTSEVHLTVHMEDDAGRHITNTKKTVIDLGFDAAAGFHTYDIVVTGKSAAFLVDGKEIHEFSAEDMPGNVWRSVPLKGIADLWAADSRFDEWAGKWEDPGRALVGRVSEASIRPGDVSGATAPAASPPSSGSGSGSGTSDTVSVRVSGDAYKGDPTFALLVNGRVVDSSTAIWADRDEGEWQTATFRGDFNMDGSDRVSVQFTNDLCHRDEDREIIGDRNLHVDSITANGDTNGRDEILFSAGTEHWDI